MYTSEVQRLGRVSTYFLSEIHNELVVQSAKWLRWHPILGVTHTTGLIMNYMMPLHMEKALLNKTRQSHREEKA